MNNVFIILVRMMWMSSTRVIFVQVQLCQQNIQGSNRGRTSSLVAGNGLVARTDRFKMTCSKDLRFWEP